MRVLDLDLDFFLASCCPLAEPGSRPALSGHEPWEADRVTDYLAAHCGLSAEHPCRGRIFTTHDGALRFWRERIDDGTLTVPFTVVHIDAHSDLGIGYPGAEAILNGVLPVRTDRRAELTRYYDRRQLDEANYLLYALAFRWVDRLVNVRNPDSRPDLPKTLTDPAHPDRLRLKTYVSALMEGINGAEPPIPYTVFDDPTRYVETEPFDFVTLAQSPRYAPREADALIEVIRPFLRPM